MKVEVELHNVDTEVEVYDNLRGEGDLGDEADVENPPDENVPTGLYPKGPVIHMFYSDKKHTKKV